jgi:hypothetical protein
MRRPLRYDFVVAFAVAVGYCVVLWEPPLLWARTLSSTTYGL